MGRFSSYRLAIFAAFAFLKRSAARRDMHSDVLGNNESSETSLLVAMVAAHGMNTFTTDTDRELLALTVKQAPARRRRWKRPGPHPRMAPCHGLGYLHVINILIYYSSDPTLVFLPTNKLVSMQSSMPECLRRLEGEESPAGAGKARRSIFLLLSTATLPPSTLPRLHRKERAYEWT